MQVKLVSSLMIAGLLISQVSLASPEPPFYKSAHQYQNTPIDIPMQPSPSDLGADPIEEGDNGPVIVYAC